MKTPAEVFTHWNHVLEARRQEVPLEGDICWDLTGEPGGKWLMCKAGSPAIREGGGEADCTLSLSTEDFLLIASGELNPQAAYLNGQVSVQGDLSAVLALSVVLDELVEGKPS